MAASTKGSAAEVLISRPPTHIGIRFSGVTALWTKYYYSIIISHERYLVAFKRVRIFGRGVHISDLFWIEDGVGGVTVTTPL